MTGNLFISHPSPENQRLIYPRPIIIIYNHSHLFQKAVRPGFRDHRGLLAREFIRYTLSRLYFFLLGISGSSIRLDARLAVKNYFDTQSIYKARK